jgi:peroxiredoxin
MGYQIVAVSPDRPAKLRETMTSNELGFQLLSDSSMTTAVAFGLAWQASQTFIDEYLSFGLDLEGAAGMDHHMVTVPAVFIVRMDGEVRFVYFNPNHRERLETDALMSAARAAMEKPAD